MVRLIFASCFACICVCTSSRLQQVDQQLLDDLLAEVVASSIGDVRQRLHEAVFAAAFRRRVASMSHDVDLADLLVDRVVDARRHAELPSKKLSVALETYTQAATPRLVVADAIDEKRLADDVVIEYVKVSNVTDDDVAMRSEWVSQATTWLNLVPTSVVVAVAVLSTVALLATAALVVAALCRHSQRRRDACLLTRRRRQMPDPMTVAGCCGADCGSATSFAGLRAASAFSNRSQSTSGQQDRAVNAVWASHPRVHF